MTNNPQTPDLTITRRDTVHDCCRAGAITVCNHRPDEFICRKTGEWRYVCDSGYAVRAVTPCTGVGHGATFKIFGAR